MVHLPCSRCGESTLVTEMPQPEWVCRTCTEELDEAAMRIIAEVYDLATSAWERENPIEWHERAESIAQVRIMAPLMKLVKDKRPRRLMARAPRK